MTGIFLHREKFKDSQRVKISYFAFSFFEKPNETLFKTGISYVFESNTFSRPFLKKKYIHFIWNNNFPDIFLPLVKLQYFSFSSSRDLIMKNWDKLSLQAIVRVKLRERAMGRKAILQSLWLQNFQATKASEAFFFKKAILGSLNSHYCKLDLTNLSDKREQLFKALSLPISMQNSKKFNFFYEKARFEEFCLERIWKGIELKIDFYWVFQFSLKPQW